MLHNNIVYPLLKKFVESGWVEQKTVPGDRGQQRKQYRITAAGKRHLMQQIATFAERDAANDGEFLFRVAMFDLLPEERRKEILAARKAYLIVRIGELDELKKTGTPKSFSSIVLEHFQDLVRDEMKWISGLEHSRAGNAK